MSGDRFGRSSEMEGSIREYAIYFTGIGDGPDREVSLDRLLNELPYEDSDVVDDLEWLERHNYVEKSHEEIFPVETDGFDRLLENTEFGDVHEASYRLGEAGKEFVTVSGIDDYERSLKYVFQE